MPITVNTNVSALIAQNNLISANNNLNKVLQQMSTGLRINTARDDAAGLAVAVGMESQIIGNTKAAENIQNGINLMQTAEGGMDTITEHIQRVRELCLQAATEIYSTDNKIAMLNEMKQRIADVDIQAQSVNFNGINLLDGTRTSLCIQFGAGTDPALNSIDIGPTLTNMRIDDTGLDIELKVTTGVVPAGSDYVNIADWKPDDIMAYMDQLDDALSKITSDRSLLGAYSNRLDSNATNLTSQNENVEESKSRIMDVDLAQASTKMVKYQILQQATTSVLGQANTVPQLALQLLQ